MDYSDTEHTTDVERRCAVVGRTKTVESGVAGKADDSTGCSLLHKSERREFTVADGRTKVTFGKQCNEGDLKILADWSGGGE